ncbi:hypothetical protein SB717_15570 [Priestia sp. SIMBA_032]
MTEEEYKNLDPTVQASIDRIQSWVTMDMISQEEADGYIQDILDTVNGIG